MRLSELGTTVLNENKFEAAINRGVIKLAILFKKHSKELRVVGGAVRDLAQGKDPKDIDLASDATPNEMIRMIEGIYKHIPTGLQHGTITILVPKEPEEMRIGSPEEREKKHHEFEVTTLRVDVETDGRHAEVEFTTDWKKDAERRDLTYNAMSLNPLSGEVYDYFNGLADLEAERTLFVGNADDRIQEDYLRILRYFRFLGRTEGVVDDEHLESIKRNSHGLDQISVERIWMEMQKILTGKNLEHILEVMRETNVDAYISLEINNINAAIVARDSGAQPVSVLTALIDNLEEAKDTVNRWKLSGDEENIVDMAISLEKKKPDHIYAEAQYKDITQKLIGEVFLMKGDTEEATKWFNKKEVTFPVSGNDLKSIGLLGKSIGDMKSYLQQVFIDTGEKASKEELMAIARQKIAGN